MQRDHSHLAGVSSTERICRITAQHFKQEIMIKTDLSRFPTLKSALSFPSTPLSFPHTVLPDLSTALFGGLTSTINGACGVLRAARRESQSLIKLRVCDL